MSWVTNKRVVIGSRDQELTSTDEEKEKEDSPKPNKVSSFSEAEEMKGKLAHSEQLDKLMRSVLENDKDLIEEGKILSEGTDAGMQSFTPELMFEQLTKNYKTAKKIYGERLIRQATGHSSGYIERNIKIPEFRRELKGKLEQSMKSLQDKGLIDNEGQITEDGMTIASISMVKDELERMNKKGLLGERANKVRSADGVISDQRAYRTSDHYKDINIKSTIKKTLRRGRGDISTEDLVVNENESKERATIIYALDASGSMRGEKFSAAKRAGIALAYKAISKQDRVGCIIFGKEVTSDLPPTKDFMSIVRLITRARASRETDIAATIMKAQELFDNHKCPKHLIILTDGLQTVGKDPDKLVLDAAGVAAQMSITISVVGLNLDAEGEALSKKIVEVGKGNLYLVKNYEDLDVLLIEDYYKTRR